MDAYYQCYKRKNCVNFVLENYRLHYPDGSVVLVCDGGDDFQSISKQYKCHYFFRDKINTGKNLIFEDINSTSEFFFRLSDYISFLNGDFFILLEDDVFVKSKTDYKSLKYDINGCNINEFLNERTIDYLNKNKKSNLQKHFVLGGCGGSVLRTAFFKNVLSNKNELKNNIELYCSLNEKTRWASDQILTFLCYLKNGTVGQFDGFCETWHKDYQSRLLKNNIEVLHQYKALY